jgi:hypothetical protein
MEPPHHDQTVRLSTNTVGNTVGDTVCDTSLTSGTSSEELRGEALALGNALRLDRDRLNRYLDTLQSRFESGGGRGRWQILSRSGTMEPHVHERDRCAEGAKSTDYGY